jgi:Spx/MgsR family transcriptional regulator
MTTPRTKNPSAETLRVYTLAQCSTCRDATKWLRAHEVAFEERAIRETPPSAAEIRTMLAAHGGELRRVFNTSGIEYRAQKLAEKLPGMSEAEAVALLSGNGSLVRRPFVVGRGVALVGFDAEKWAAALGAKK